MPEATTQPGNGESTARRFFSHAEIMAVIWGLMLAMFLAALDQTIVAIALYSMALDLQGEALMPWLISGYLVVATVATPIYGKLSDLYGRWPMLSTAIGIYLFASLASAAAQTMPQLLGFRLLQGLGGGGLIVLVQSIIADIVPRQQRGRYQAYLSGVFAVAAIIGPVVGGLLTEHLSWRAVYLFNVPLAIAAWLITRRGLARLPRLSRDKPIDYLGALLLGATLTTMMLALARIGRGAPLFEPTSLSLLAIAIVALLALQWRERRAADPILPPELFRNRTVVLCCAVLGVDFMIMYGCIVTVPLALQMVGGVSAGEMAVVMLPFTLGVPVGSYYSGKLMQHAARERVLLSTGTAMTTLGALIIALIDYQSGWPLFVALLMTGTGVGLCIPASVVAVQAAVQPAQIGIATATSGMARTLGGALGIALMSAMLFAAISAEAVAPVAGALLPAASQSLLGQADPADLENGFRAAFWSATIAGVIGIALALQLRRPARATLA